MLEQIQGDLYVIKRSTGCTISILDGTFYVSETNCEHKEENPRLFFSTHVECMFAKVGE